MRILVTGCAGFIGWKVCEFLLANGHSVVGVDNLNEAYDVRLKQWRLAQLEEKPGFEFQKLDICDKEAVRRSTFKVQKFDAVINLAARAGVRQSVENPWVYFDTNVTGTLNLLELCREFGVKKFVLASTSSLYGEPQVVCQSSMVNGQRSIVNSESQMANSLESVLASNQESDRRDRPNRPNRPDRPNRPNRPDRLERPFSESDPTDQPLSPYAASKKAAEALCYTYHYLYGIDVSVLRYFTVYGPAGRPDMSLFRFVQWISEGRTVTAYGDGTQSRDFTYVDDIALGTLAALKPVGYEVINLGSDHPVVLNEAIHLVERLVDRRAHVEFKPRHPADVLSTWADVSKADQILGWRPQTKFEDGVKQLVKWYQQNREWAKEIRTD